MPRTSLKPLHLIPAPKSLTLQSESFTLPQEIYILLNTHPAPPATHDAFAAERFILDAEPLTGINFHITRGPSIDPAREILVQLRETAAPDAPPNVRDQAYELTISPQGITLAASTATGIFYAFQTLLQIIRETAFKKRETQNAKREKKGSHNSRFQTSAFKLQPFSLPCLQISDFPDFPRRGVYHDTARGKVPTVDTLLQLIDDLGHLKYNEFQLYIENNFQFRKYPEMYDDTDPLTSEDLLILDAACRARHIDFVPSLTSLGHFEKILSRPTFRHLAEAEPAQLKALGATCWYEAAPWSLSVTDPEARTLLKNMYDEFLPNFTSTQFNICCDEAYDLGIVRSKDAAAKAGGTGHLYIEWINFCNTLSHSHGKSIQMWGDIILNHPDLIANLPDKTILLEWGYEHDHKFDEHCKLFAERLKRTEPKGLRTESTPAQSSVLSPHHSFHVSPGTSSWLTLAARTKNACGNIHAAATAGLKYGAHGLLLTDWGDNGHQQLLAVSMTQFAYGAAASWNLSATPNPCATTKPTSSFIVHHSSFLKSISLHLFQDPAAHFASLAYDLGLTYEVFSWQRFNASLEWYLFREKWDFANYVNRAQPKDLPKVIAHCEKLIPQFRKANLLHDHANLLIEEFIFTCEVIIHTCKRTQLRQAWLAADPVKRNPEEPTLRTKPAKPLPKTYKKQMSTLRTEAKQLKTRFQKLWLARNKKSRLEDITTEIERLEKEYQHYAK